MMQVEEALPGAAEEIRSATVYFNPAEGTDAPELLLFEEKALFPANWKRTASSKGRQFVERLRERYERIAYDLFPGDHFIHRLIHFKKITVLLNKPIEPEEVRGRLHQIFRDRYFHHLRWLFIDAALLLLSLVLMPLPGPNIPGYYLLFRVVTHWRSYRSASRAAVEEIDVQVSDHAGEVNSVLRENKDVRTGLQELRRKYGLRALQEHKFVPQIHVLKEGWVRFKQSFRHEDVR